jgi:hypothetical protein
MSDGQEYPVPTVDHVYLPPAGRRVVVSDDDGVTAVLPALHVTGVLEVLANEKQPAAG